MPGRAEDNSFRGCNNLISRNQAHLTTGAGDIAAVMDWERRGGRNAGSPVLPFPEDDERGMVLALLHNESPLDFERLMALTGLEFNSLNTILVELELEGFIVSVQGRRYALRP